MSCSCIFFEWTYEDKLILNHEYDDTIFYKYSKINQFSIEENMMMHDTIIICQ